MTVQEFYDYCEKHNCLDYEIEVQGEYYFNPIHFEEINKDPPTAKVDNERKIVWLYGEI